jgi:hypothetical protein
MTKDKPKPYVAARSVLARFRIGQPVSEPGYITQSQIPFSTGFRQPCYMCVLLSTLQLKATSTRPPRPPHGECAWTCRRRRHCAHAHGRCARVAARGAHACLLWEAASQAASPAAALGAPRRSARSSALAALDGRPLALPRPARETARGVRRGAAEDNNSAAGDGRGADRGAAQSGSKPGGRRHRARVAARDAR